MRSDIMYYQNTFSRIFLLALIIGAVAGPAAALKVEGARIALDVDAGKAYNSTIGVSIGTGEAEGDFAIDVLGFGQAPADGTYTGLEAAADTAPTTARPFITVDRPRLHLKPGERVVSTAMIRVPADFRAGGRYAIILVHPVAAAGQQASFATAVAIPVLLTAKGGSGSEAGEITSLEPGAVSEGKPVTVTTVLKNTGNLHYYGAVNRVSLTDAAEKVVSNTSTAPMTRALVPGQSVTFAVELPAPVHPGTYTITSRMEQQDGTFLDEKTASLEVKGAPAPLTAATQAETTGTPSKVPGFGVLAAVAAAGISVLACRGKR
jgi:hypothetical protein